MTPQEQGGLGNTIAIGHLSRSLNVVTVKDKNIAHVMPGDSLAHLFPTPS